MRNISELQLIITGKTPVVLAETTNISGIWLSINYMVLALVLQVLATLPRRPVLPKAKQHQAKALLLHLRKQLLQNTNKK